MDHLAVFGLKGSGVECRVLGVLVSLLERRKGRELL